MAGTKAAVPLPANLEAAEDIHIYQQGNKDEPQPAERSCNPDEKAIKPPSVGKRWPLQPNPPEKAGLFLAVANHQKGNQAKRITCKTASTTSVTIDKRRSSFDRISTLQQGKVLTLDSCNHSHRTALSCNSDGKGDNPQSGCSRSKRIGL